MQYDRLSGIYDVFNDNFDYGAYLDKIFSKFTLPQSGLVLDCGCGTGSLLSELARRGYDCTGVDASEDMLSVAREKLGDDAHLVCQRLEDIDLYGAYDIVFCSLDTVNHILHKRDLQQFFRRIYNFIEPGGSFVFDFKTRRAFETSRGVTVSEHAGDVLIVEGSFGKEYASYQFTVFEKTADNLYKRTEDYIEERFYESAELKKMLIDAGLRFVGRTQMTNRIIFAATKPMEGIS